MPDEKMPAVADGDDIFDCSLFPVASEHASGQAFERRYYTVRAAAEEASWRCRASARRRLYNELAAMLQHFSERFAIAAVKAAEYRVERVITILTLPFLRLM